MRYFIYLSYDGANYHGWQIQPNGVSVQETLQNALSTLLRHPIEVVGAGRTDAGVNASMMVAHFDVSEDIKIDATTRTDLLPYTGEVGRGLRLNRLLPPDIAVQRIVPVSDEAHARFSATSRTYHYYIALGKSPFLRHYSYRYPHPLDIDRMNEAAQVLFDYTDFTSFSKLHTDVKTNNCRIMQAHWDYINPNGLSSPSIGGFLSPDDGGTEGGVKTIDWGEACLVFTITADRFLRNMVRAIVGTLLDVGRGVLTVDQFRAIIEKKDRCAAGSSVPGNALFLADITYPEELQTHPALQAPLP